MKSKQQEEQLKKKQEQQQKKKKQEEQKKQDILGEVMVQYNHYKKMFPIKNGQLLSQSIDNEYCISYVFKGDFKMQISQKASQQDGSIKTIKIQDNGKFTNQTIFYGLQNGKKYQLSLIEDPVQAAIDQQNHKSYQYVPAGGAFGNSGGIGGKANVDKITQQLKNMDIKDIQQKGEDYKKLIEARDLQDILYS